MKTLLILLLFTSTAFAQEQEIPFSLFGYVFHNGQPVAGAKVTATKIQCGEDLKIMTAETGVDGRYFFGNLPHGKIMLEEMSGKSKPDYSVKHMDKQGNVYKTVDY